MTFHELLHQREALLHQARLANLAFACDRFADFARRLDRARIRSEVTLRLADPAADQPWPVLLARDGSQSVIEEHFTEADICELADIFAYFREDPGVTEFTFQLADLERRFLAVFRRALEVNGVSLDGPSAPGTSLAMDDRKHERG